MVVLPKKFGATVSVRAKQLQIRLRILNFVVISFELDELSLERVYLNLITSVQSGGLQGT